MQKKNGFLSFSLRKLTLLGGHEPILPPKSCLFDVQICTLNRSRDYPSAFCREPWCSPNCSRASISRIKLPTCAYSWHIAAQQKKTYSYEVTCFVKRIPVSSYTKSMQSLPEIHKTLVFLMENGGTVEGRLRRFGLTSPYWAPKSPMCTPLVLKKVMVKPNDF